jgi:hypothetical protein
VLSRKRKKVRRRPAASPDRQGPIDRRQRFHARRREERSPGGHPHLAEFAGLQHGCAHPLLRRDESARAQYKQDDDVAFTWSTKGKVTKCSIYLESWDADVKTGGTGTIVGCEANGVSGIPVTTGTDASKKASSSSDPKHLNDILELFKKQSDRAKQSLGAKG